LPSPSPTSWGSCVDETGSTRSRRRILRDGHFHRRTFSESEVTKNELLAAARHLGRTTTSRHFTPRYRPWKRIAYIPDGDLYKAIASGKASVVTDEIERFDAAGIQLKSGRRLDPDIIVTATGFHLNALGDIDFSIDGKPLAFADTVTYRGMMFTGVPNMAWVFGYFRAAWTLRADLVADFVCRLLNHMKARQARMVFPVLRPEDAGMKLLWIDDENTIRATQRDSTVAEAARSRSGPTQDYWAEKDAARHRPRGQRSLRLSAPLAATDRRNAARPGSR
jgi:cation diffusion facilitator CzcD-associated flavoprotein CzcO